VGLGIFLAAAVIVPLVAGILLDGVLRSGPLFLFVGLLVGVAAAAAVVYTRFIRPYS